MCRTSAVPTSDYRIGLCLRVNGTRSSTPMPRYGGLGVGNLGSVIAEESPGMRAGFSGDQRPAAGAVWFRHRG